MERFLITLLCCGLLASCGGGGGGAAYLGGSNSPVTVKLVTYNTEDAGVVTSAIAGLVDRYRAVGIELSVEQHLVELVEPVPFPSPTSSGYYGFLRDVVGSNGALIVVTKGPVDPSVYPGRVIDGLATLGCKRGLCQAWAKSYLGRSADSQADLLAYELAHLFGVGAVDNTEETDERALAGRDVSGIIERINENH